MNRSPFSRHGLLETAGKYLSGPRLLASFIVVLGSLQASAELEISLEDRVITIVGTDGDDEPYVYVQSSYIWVYGINPDPDLFLLSDVDRIDVKTLAGNDKVDIDTMYDGDQLPDITINTSSGDDTIHVGAEIAGSLKIRTGSGDDVVEIIPAVYSDGTALGSLDVSTGEGFDKILVYGVTVIGESCISTGAGRDRLRVHGSTFEGRFAALMGDGNDRVRIGLINNRYGGHSVVFESDALFGLSAGTDNLHLWNARIDGLLGVNGGGGDDCVFVKGALTVEDTAFVNVECVEENPS